MLKIKTKQKGAVMKRVVALFATVFLFGGAYVLSLVGAPAVAPLIVMKPINVNALPAPTSTQDRIVIPKIGVNIAYAPGESSLDKGAQWRYPERGNPEMGGNFIIAAHRFSIQQHLLERLKNLHSIMSINSQHQTKSLSITKELDMAMKSVQ